MDALWSFDDTPITARKILQNAIWGLRRVFAAHGGEGPDLLLTQAPGYRLQVAPERVDLHLFHQWTATGRAELANGAPEAAASQFRAALALWRGPALADLEETGRAWPEVITAQNARLDVLEDYFEAELACGRPHAILGELEAMVDNEPPRERACGQLMHALYYCGRQADALNVYQRMRIRLVEEFGLQPSPELQLLQHAILTQDLGLGPQPPVALRETRRPALSSGATTAHRVQPPGVRDTAPPVSEQAARQPRQVGLPVPVSPTETVVASERRQMSVVLVQTWLCLDLDSAGATEIDQVMEEAAVVIRERAGNFGGFVMTSMGSLSMLVFSARNDQDTHAERAVRAAAVIRDSLGALAAPGTHTSRFVRGLSVHAAVATGEAFARPGPNDGPPVVNGALLDYCRSLLSAAPADDIHVCDRTRLATGPSICYEQVEHQGGDSPVRWRMCDGHGCYDHELELLQQLLERAHRSSAPHLVTVLGGSGIARSRLFIEFQRRVREQLPEPASYVCVSAAPSGERTLMPYLAVPPEGNPDHLLVVIADDLHHADDRSLDLMENLTDTLGPVPALIIVGAKPELLDRRPGWAGGKRHAITITLDPLMATVA
ncbi:AfsR/SARP family transcriptional regulator [Herbidospora mongoliensis]|uniref:AfsR/SARP family transcriptional regulator n=1 Tax=Herbidospora mongoliensis TaxID=688067 RepID=UPI000A90E611